MNWNDLSPEAKIYIELSPVEFAKTSMAASISLYWRMQIALKNTSVLFQIV